MFFAEALALAVPFVPAQRRLREYLRTDGLLQRACDAALHHALNGLFTDDAAPVTFRTVTLPPYQRGDTMVVALRTTGGNPPAAPLVPIIDANLELRPGDDHTTHLELRGSYHPPGSINPDRAADGQSGHDARRTAAGLLRRIAGALARPVAQDAALT